MATTRMIKTIIWEDEWFFALSDKAQRLYLYLITNKNTEISGIYRLPLIEMVMYTKYKEDQVKKLLADLYPKISYLDGWVIIPNYPEHQNVGNNEKVQRSIEKYLEKIPAHVLNHKSEIINHKSVPMDRVSIPYKNEEKVDKPVENVVAYGEFRNVKLSNEEKVRVINRYGRSEAKKLVEELSTYLSSSGKRYKSHYATLLAWARRKGLPVVEPHEPEMVAEMQSNGMVKMVPNPKYNG